MQQHHKPSSTTRRDLPSRLGWRPSGFRDLQPEPREQPRHARRERPYAPSIEQRVADAVAAALADVRIVHGEDVFEQPAVEACWWRNPVTGLPDCGQPASVFVDGLTSIGVAGAIVSAGLHVCDRHARDAIELRERAA